MYKEQLKEFEEIFDNLASKYGSYNVFYDFVKMCAISIYNSFSKDEKMEKEYLRTINIYSKEHQQLFPKMFGKLILAYEEAKDIVDILGPFYERHQLGNSKMGQFFTPSHISDFIAKIMVGEEKTIRNKIKEKGFITMSEPTCGAGGMILSFAKALKDQNINYQQELLVEAVDLSDICVYMTYVQLSLYGIPAVVYCGNTLSQEVRFKLETPLYFFQYWRFNKFYKQNKENKITSSDENQDKIIIEKPIENQNLYKEVTVKGNCQISLW